MQQMKGIKNEFTISRYQNKYMLYQLAISQISNQIFILTQLHNFMLEKYKFHWLGNHDTQMLVACTFSKG